MKHGNIAIFVPHMGCPNQCSFYNQHLISGTQTPPTPNDVHQICTQVLEDVPSDQKQIEIAFFGGSFTAIDRGYMTDLLQAASAYLGNGRFSGIRISTRPDAIDREILSILKHYGVTAIELGAQSMDDTVLQKNRRGHTAADVERASDLIRRCGFSLGLQMMVGLYGDSKERLYQTAERLIACEPDTMRIYPTVILQGTHLAELYLTGKYVPMTLKDAVAVCTDLLIQFTKAGIRVIRLGLHDSPELIQNCIGGLYHPAFRELCESRIYYQKALAALQAQSLRHCLLLVHPREISKMIGQSRSNITALQEAGYTVKVMPDPDLIPYEVLIQPIEREV